MCQHPPVQRGLSSFAKCTEWKRPTLCHVKNPIVFAPSGTLVPTVGIIVLSFTLREISEIECSLFGKPLIGDFQLEILLESWEWIDALYYFIIISVVTFALVRSHTFKF